MGLLGPSNQAKKKLGSTTPSKEGFGRQSSQKCIQPASIGQTNLGDTLLKQLVGTSNLVVGGIYLPQFEVISDPEPNIYARSKFCLSHGAFWVYLSTRVEPPLFHACPKSPLLSQNQLGPRCWSTHPKWLFCLGSLLHLPKMGSLPRNGSSQSTCRFRCCGPTTDCGQD